MKKYVWIFALVLCIPASLGCPCINSENPDFWRNLDAGITLFEDTDRLPWAVEQTFGSARINAYVELRDGKTILLHAITDDGKVVDWGDGHLEHPTMHINITESAIKDIVSAEEGNYYSMWTRTVSEGRFAYEGVGLLSKWRVSLLKAIAGL